MDAKKLQRDLDNFARKQVPFAVSQAINTTAKKVQAAERENMAKVLDRPTPFTVNAVGVKLSTKSNLTATVYVKDIAAAYLEPYETGGRNKLNAKALIKPVGQKVNQYGNLPRTTVKRLAAKRNVFVGKVKTKAGEVDGVWRRSKAVRGKHAGLKLLVKFQDAHEARNHLNYQGVARKVVAASFRRELDKALAKALATAR
ncbi:hypothetical protein RSP673_011110 [Ralstonia solanacearum P673]|uniref:hypothetical protein n=1 Tax=Ralstonia solanacearum TaxID=305 RepID=UPI0004B23B13|nr:hypothetical protein [Ralstonia solanacearum]MCL9851204.1 hypothetical protein [Ralstonia solanacearum]MCL9855781.1 hypothetical protein [Ralstonia solanacearum]MCL9860297.1 hypothetical protein [Ralstonia solanacearum]MCL9865528.1 hypothetical protein [Ralstonia solanacearum]MCL9870011.1 hypothetical protein [Ralstonia solanacearum]